MSTGVLQTGSRVIILKNTEKDNNEYTSQIESVDGKKIRILAPMYKSALIKLHEGLNINLTVFSDGKLYRFDAIVDKSVSEGMLHYVDIIVSSKIEKIERRDYFRIQTMKEVLIRKKEISNEKQKDNNYTQSVLIDLSGGGMQFSTREKFKAGDEIDILINIEGKDISLAGKILNINEQSELRTYRYGVEFKDMDRMIRENIVTYVFKTQREQLRKNNV